MLGWFDRQVEMNAMSHTSHIAMTLRGKSQINNSKKFAKVAVKIPVGTRWRLELQHVGFVGQWLRHWRGCSTPLIVIHSYIVVHYVTILGTY